MSAQRAPGGMLRFGAPDAAGVATLAIANPGKRNALDIGMWRALREGFEHWSALPAADAPRVVVVQGDGGDFASGGDIEEFATFRFEADRLAHFHEEIVAPALHAMRDCEIPLIAAIDGACLGGGLEIAACCDVRVAAASSRFGAPIAKLGFPMAPQELALLADVFATAALREMLLEAVVHDAAGALRLGLVHEVVEDGLLTVRARERALRMAGFGAEAARANKRTLRQIAAGGPGAQQRRDHFAYAPNAEHREGIAAFIEKRTARFERG